MESIKCAACGIFNFNNEAACKKCGHVLVPLAPLPVDTPSPRSPVQTYLEEGPALAPWMASTAARNPCPRCRSELFFIKQNPDKGSGCIIAILGAVLAPALIGIPILIYGLHMASKQRNFWHCRGCGTMFPA